MIRAALQQVSADPRPGRKVLIRTDAAGCTHDVLNWLAARRLGYSLGFTLTETHARKIRALPVKAWDPGL